MGRIDSVCERDNGVVHVWGACRLHAWASMVWMGVCMDASIACIDTLMACAGVLAVWIGVPPTRVGVRAFVDERFFAHGAPLLRRGFSPLSRVCVAGRFLSGQGDARFGYASGSNCQMEKCCGQL